MLNLPSYQYSYPDSYLLVPCDNCLLVTLLCAKACRFTTVDVTTSNKEQSDCWVFGRYKDINIFGVIKCLIYV